MKESDLHVLGMGVYTLDLSSIGFEFESRHSFHFGWNHLLSIHAKKTKNVLVFQAFRVSFTMDPSLRPFVYPFIPILSTSCTFVRIHKLGRRIDENGMKGHTKGVKKGSKLKGCL